jgi:hypothetical protein
MVHGRLATGSQRPHAVEESPLVLQVSQRGYKMSQFKPVLKTVALAALVLACGAHAQTTDRTEQLEKEIRDIKVRLSNLEAAQSKPAASAMPVRSGDGWKALANWRALRSGMSPIDVRGLLGEPARLDGGEVARWYYPGDGRVVFMGEKLYQWTEPTQN